MSTVGVPVSARPSPGLTGDSESSGNHPSDDVEIVTAIPIKSTRGFPRTLAILGLVGSIVIVPILCAVIWMPRGTQESASVSDESQSLVLILKEEANRMQADAERTRQTLDLQKRRITELQKELQVLGLEVSKLEKETAL